MNDLVDHHIDLAIQVRNHNRNTPIPRENKCPKVTLEQQSVLLGFMKHTKDREEVRWKILNSVLAMSDTCSTLASSVLFLLSRGPSV